jgi:signal transduction histidine kinase
VLLSVADDGPGIPAADRPKALERFERLASSEDRPGTGLGLALVAAVAQSHGARLELADATPGAARPGLCVSLDFPPAE